MKKTNLILFCETIQGTPLNVCKWVNDNKGITVVSIIHFNSECTNFYHVFYYQDLLA